MQQPNNLTPNTKLSGRYIIISHLGGGGFGQTYLAEDRQLPSNPQCVVKQFRPKFTDPNALQVARRLFNTEAETLYKFGTHDRIPRLLAHFEEDNEFFLVQEFIEGHDLDKEIVLGKKLSEAEAASIILEILEILSFVHKENAIHRDIKPSNIIRRKKDHKLVLIDFGAVKQLGVDTSIGNNQTTLTIAIGTPGYMPNEQACGKPRLCSDVYAVGIIGIQALTGLSPNQIQEDPITGEIVWRSQVQASQELLDILDRMVRYDFRQRYQSAVEALQSFPMQAATHVLPDNDLPTLQVTPIVPSPLSPTIPQTHQVPQTIKPKKQLGDFQKILLLGGLIGTSIISGLILTRTPQPQIVNQQNTQDLSRATPSPLISSPAISPKSIELKPNININIPSEKPPRPEIPPFGLPRNSPPNLESIPSPSISPVIKPPLSSSQGWRFIGSASTGENIYLDSSSIRKSGADIRFTYKIGNEIIAARAECSSNRWYADSYGWLSPQSQATQIMLNDVCSF